MTTGRLPAILALLVFVPLLAHAAGITTDVVQLHSGPIRGTREANLHIFRGIPYAAPPVGSLRWKPPQEVSSWTEPRDCIAYGHSCPQPGLLDAGSCSEDCLFLNVWTPAKSTDAKLPVMVWIHGGGFNFGSASQPEYNAANLARKGVVVVSLNYRLGPLGFLVHPLLALGSPHGTSGNYGLLDQIAALKWVAKNITAFGGDAARVTLFGQSAGSRSVSLLMISPLTEGLFHRAIAQSGGPIIGSEYLNPSFNGNMAFVSKMGERLASRLSCDGEKDVLARMRAKPAGEIIEAADSKTDIFNEDTLFFAPVFDGWVLPESPLAAYTCGQQHDVPVIAGSTLNEGTIYLAGQAPLSLEKYAAFLKSRFGDNDTLAMKMFPVHGARDVGPTIDKILTVAVNAQPARLIAQSMERKKSAAYLYQFTRLPGTPMARRLGVHHGAELAYVFGNLPASEGYTDTDTRLAGFMMEYWVNFAKTGNPNAGELLEWPPYTGAADISMEFADDLRLNRHLFKEECDFITRMNSLRGNKGSNGK